MRLVAIGLDHTKTPAALREAVGSDLAELLAAVSQLSSDIESDMIDAADVAQYYEGINKR